MPSPRTRAAFTLVELLTVIAIIAILMGLLFPAMNSVKEAARKTQAKNDETQIVTAIKAFYTEYGKYPTADNADKVYSSTNSTIIDVLRNMSGTTTGNALNPRQIVFLDAPTSKVTPPKAGLDANGVYFDPWGTAYSLAMDADYDNQIKAGIHGYKDTSFATLSTGAIVWSFGKDKKIGINGGGTYVGSDDVISWQ